MTDGGHKPRSGVEAMDGTSAAALSASSAARTAVRRRCMLTLAGAWVVFLAATFAVPSSAQMTSAAGLGLAFVLAGLLLVVAWGANAEFAALVVFLTVMALARVFAVAAGAADLSGDEAHYWEWSRRLDISYYSKPPGVAYLIRLGTSPFGDTELGVRAPAVILGFGAGLAMYKLASRLYDAKTGALAAGLTQIIPLLVLGQVGMIPDTPLLFFWTVGLLTLHWACQSDKPVAWVALGLVLGLGLLGKLAIIFFYIPAALFLLSTATGRKRLRTPWPYAAFAVSLVFLTPVAVWNAQHGWVTLRHDMAHADVDKGAALSLVTFANFAGSQLAVVTPVIFALMLYAIIKTRKENPLSFWFTIPILAGFALKSLQGKVQANWAMAGYIAAVAPFAALYMSRFRELSKGMRRLVGVGVGIAAVATAFSLYPGALAAAGLPPDMDPTTRLKGWKELGREVSAMDAAMQGERFIFSDNYMTASALAFYVEGHPTTYCVNLGRRMNQYDIWPGFQDLYGYNAIYVSSREMPRRLANAFASVTPHPIVIRDSKGKEIKRFEAYMCYDFLGMSAPRPKTY